MKKEDLYESIGGVDEELLARSENAAAGKKSGRVLSFRVIGVAAACVCVAAAITALPFLLSGQNGNHAGTLVGEYSGTVGDTEVEGPGQDGNHAGTLEGNYSGSAGDNETENPGQDDNHAGTSEGEYSGSAGDNETEDPGQDDNHAGTLEGEYSGSAGDNETEDPGQDDNQAGTLEGEYSGSVDDNETENPSGEIAKFPSGGFSGQMNPDADLYPELNYGGIQYTERYYSIPDEVVGEYLGSTMLEGTNVYDIVENRYVPAKAEIFRIKGIAESCALALRVGDDPVCFPYVNSLYAPATLGQFIEDLDLANTLSFGPVYSGNESVIYVGRSTGSGGNTAAVTVLPADAAWSILLANGSAKAVEYDSVELTKTGLYNISVDLCLFGYHNVSMAVTADGYLTTNLLDTGKAFFIGKDAVKRFAAYMEANFKAVKYTPAGYGEGIPE